MKMALLSSGAFKDGERAFVFLRIMYGILLLSHGLDKIANYDLFISDFPAPLGMSRSLSLLLAIFSEFLCGAFIATGLFFRLSCLPVIATFLVAFFIVHQNDEFAAKELALIYLILALYLFFRGPGPYSADAKLFPGA